MNEDMTSAKSGRVNEVVALRQVLGQVLLRRICGTNDEVFLFLKTKQNTFNTAEGGKILLNQV
jgi:hypothetical protein